MGVAVDWEVDKGSQFLRGFGQFDEVSVGYNWASSAVRRYMFEDFTGIPATPQIVVVKRFLHVAGASQMRVAAIRVPAGQAGEGDKDGAGAGGGDCGGLGGPGH